MNIFKHIWAWMMSDRSPDGFTVDQVQINPSEYNWLVYRGQVFEGRFATETEARNLVKRLVEYPVITKTAYFDSTGKEDASW